MQTESPLMRGNDGNLVKFFWVQARNDRSSDEQGRPIYDKVLKIEIMSPGAKNQLVTHEVRREFWVQEGETRPPRVNQQLERQYAEQLRAWEANSAEELAGTPLHEIRAFDVGIIASLKEMNFHTVEALASAPDTALSFMGGRKWQELARNYLKEADGQKPLAELTARNEELEMKVMELEDRLKALDTEDKKPGRKKAA